MRLEPHAGGAAWNVCGKDVKSWVNRKFFFLLFLAVLTACPPVCVCAPNKAEISNIEIDKKGKDLEASFRLIDCFNSDMEEAILDGVPTTFKIIVSLLRSPLCFYLQRSPILPCGIQSDTTG